MKRPADKPTPKRMERTGRLVRPMVRGHERAVATIAGSALLEGVCEALFLVTITRTGFAIKDGQDRVGVVSGWDASVRSLLAVAALLLAARMALAAYTSWQSAKLSNSVIAQLRQRLTDAFLDSSWEAQQAQRSGSVQELLTSFSSKAAGMMSGVTSLTVAVGNLVAMLGIAVAVDPIGAVVMAVSVTVLGLALRPFQNLVKRRSRRASFADMEFAIAVNEISELGFELHVFHVQDRAKARVGRAIEQVRKSTVRYQFASGLSAPVYTGLAYLAIVGALGAVASANTTKLASLSATMLVMLRSLTYGQGVQSASLGIAGTIPAMEEIQRRLQTFDAGRRSDEGKPVDRVGVIAMENVSFAYAHGAPVLRGVSFTVEPHEIIGIVGPSGAGKSTLVQLLLGLRDPDQGRILADGREISTFDRAEWARKVTFVPQGAHMIAGTIADNIRFLRDGVHQDDVERAARLAHLHDEIEGFPEGYERQVGKQGGHLSGGQQQRLCIARALVERPDMLILDEPTSALDVGSEHAIRTTLLSLKDRMTVIIIAHRLSTLTICDRIMVVKDGELKAFDTPSALEQSSDFYRQALALSGMR